MHERRFVLDAAWAPVAVRVLRRGDGTGWFVFGARAPGETEIERGDYRFSFVFRRRCPDGPVLYQAGMDGDEVVSIDVPWETVGS